MLGGLTTLRFFFNVIYDELQFGYIVVKISTFSSYCLGGGGGHKMNTLGMILIALTILDDPLKDS